MADLTCKIFITQLFHKQIETGNYVCIIMIGSFHCETTCLEVADYDIKMQGTLLLWSKNFRASMSRAKNGK